MMRTFYTVLKDMPKSKNDKFKVLVGLISALLLVLLLSSCTRPKAGGGTKTMSSNDGIDGMVEQALEAMPPEIVNDPEKAQQMREFLRQSLIAYAGEQVEESAPSPRQETTLDKTKLKRVTLEQHSECKPMSGKKLRLDFTRNYNPIDFERMGYGLDATSMDEKWIMILDSNVLRMWSSWPLNKCIFEMSFVAAGNDHRIAEVWVDQGFVSQPPIDVAYAKELLQYLIERMLLGHTARFPFPKTTTDIMQKSMFRHGLVGSSQANDETEP
jgi:hypothetical protein